MLYSVSSNYVLNPSFMKYFSLSVDIIHPAHQQKEVERGPRLIWRLIGCSAGVCFSVGAVGIVGGLVSMLWALIGHGEAN